VKLSGKIRLRTT